MVKNYFILFIILFLSLRCSRNNSNPIETSFNDLEGLWKTNGIVVNNDYQNLGNETEYYLQNDIIQILNRNYFIDNTSNSWKLLDYSIRYYEYNDDNNYLTLTNRDNPTISYPTTLHYLLNNDKLNISTGYIYKGNSNTLLNTLWEYKVSYYQERILENYIYQELYIDDTHGVQITNDLNKNMIDTTYFTYVINGNEINISYQNPNIEKTYKFEIKNNKLYKYVITGTNKDIINLELIKQTAPPNCNIDFLPLKKDNSWTYNYYYCQPYCYARTEGKIKWTVTEGNNSYFEIQEIYSGFNINNTNSDTVNFGPDTSYFSIQQENNTLTMDPTFFNSGKVNFSRFYTLTDEKLTISLISDDGVSQEIELTKNLGITKWIFGGSHNGEEIGTIILESDVLKSN